MGKPTFAKDKVKQREAAAELLAEPQTLMARLFDALRPHLGKIAIVLAGVLVAIVGLSVWSGWQERQAARATDAFTKLMTEATATVDEAGPQIDLIDPSSPQVKEAKFKTFEERTKAALEIARTTNFGSDKVAERAKVVEAGLLYDGGKYDEAIAAYRAFLAASPGAELAARAREGIGYALEAKALAQTDAAARNAGLDEAQKAFVDIDPDEKGAYHALSLYHQARIKALKGDKPGAVEMYKKALEKNPPPELTDDINSRLSLLES